MAEEPQIERIEIPLPNNHVLTVQVSLASLPLVPPPRSPRKDEWLFRFNVDRERVVMIEAGVELLPGIPVIPPPRSTGTGGG